MEWATESHASAFAAAALGAHAVAALSMTYIPRKDTGARVTAVIAIATLCFHAIAATDRWTDEGQNCAEYMFGFMLHANCFLILNRLRAPHTGKTTWQRLRWATVALFTPRRELPKNLHWREHCPGRWLFIAQRTVKAAVFATTYEYLRDHPLIPFTPRPYEIAPDKDSMVLQLYSGTLTRRDLLIRAEMTLLSLTLPALFIDIQHTICSIFATLLFDSEPADWPPLFGNILEAYTVGRWYGRFWEQLMRKAFTKNARAFLTGVLRLKKRGRVTHMLVIIVSFALSGLMHTVSGWTPGPCASWMPMWTYLSTGVVVLLESLLFVVYGRIVHGKDYLGWEWTSWEVWFWRLLGYCWVAFWWMEVLPWAIMPGMRRARIADHL